MSIQQREFECPQCGNIVSAPKSRRRTEIGHVKTMYCYRCKVKTDHVQVSEFRSILDAEMEKRRCAN